MRTMSWCMVVRFLFTQHFLNIVGILESASPKEEVQSCTQAGSDKENTGTMVFFYISIDSAKQTRH